MAAIKTQEDMVITLSDRKKLMEVAGLILSAQQIIRTCETVDIQLIYNVNNGMLDLAEAEVNEKIDEINNKVRHYIDDGKV